MTPSISPSLLDALDLRIKTLSQRSENAPSDFLEAELRRAANVWLVRGWIDDAHRPDQLWWSTLKEKTEEEYAAYFERDRAEKELRPNYWWQNVYAGCNAQIEEFLIENGFAAATETLGWTDPWQAVRSVKNSALPDPVRRYLIGIGYLYPSGDEVMVHSNVVRAQGRGIYPTADSAFLTRDLIRCPYHEANGTWHSPTPIDDKGLWSYWTDLAALSIAGLPEHILYRPAEFHDKSLLDGFVRWHLDVGKRLAPQRYVESGPKMERFEWYTPPECPERPSRW